MKKFVSLLLALMLVLALGSMAFAADPTPSPATITVQSPVDGKTYSLFEILDMTAYDNTDDDFTGVSYCINTVWEDFFDDALTDGKYNLVDETGYKALADKTGYVQLTRNDDAAGAELLYIKLVKDGDDKNIDDFAQDALAYAYEENIAPTATKTATKADAEKGIVGNLDSDGNLVFDAADGVSYGYYLVYPEGATEKDTNGSICSLDSSAPTADITIKATYPTITKEADCDEAELGGGVNFTITGSVPDTTGFDSYDYIIYDTMTGLTFGEITSVTIDGEDAVYTSVLNPEGIKDQDGESISPDFSVTIDMTDYQDKIGKEVVVIYSTTMATGNGTANNEAFLEYSNDPGDDESTAKTPDVNDYVSASAIVVDKIDGTTDAKLQGAEFVLYRVNGDGKNEYYKEGISWYTLQENETLEDAIAATNITKKITDKDGAATFDGLVSGTYYLVEIKAPNGYNRLTDPEEVEVSGETDAQIENFSGTVLPSTGGIGTTIFYIVGGLLVVGAAVLIVTKKRAGAAEE